MAEEYSDGDREKDRERVQEASTEKNTSTSLRQNKEKDVSIANTFL